MADDAIDKLAKTLVETLPEGLRTLRDDIEQNFRSVLRSGLARLDLVTREEFDVQQDVLARSREKLEALEARLEKLESGGPKKKTARGAKKKATKKKTGKSTRKSTRKKTAR